MKNALPCRQKGAVLAISLIILVLMTIIGVSSIQTTIMEERMTGNMRDQNIAFQSAEAAIREAENYVENDITTTGDFGTQNGLFDDPENEPEDPWAAATWTTAANYRSATAPEGSASSKYWITLTGKIVGTTGALNAGKYGDNKGAGDITTFRILARGTGATDDAGEVMIRSQYGRRF